MIHITILSTFFETYIRKTSDVTAQGVRVNPVSMHPFYECDALRLMKLFQFESKKWIHIFHGASPGYKY